LDLFARYTGIYGQQTTKSSYRLVHPQADKVYNTKIEIHYQLR